MNDTTLKSASTGNTGSPGNAAASVAADWRRNAPEMSIGT